MPSDFDNNLLDYFTDVEHLRGMFKEYVAASVLPKRMIVIHGVGGVGKSSLLRMFRLHCKSEKIPVALISGDDAKSAFDVITRWMDDLKADGVKFSSLSKTIETYRAIQAKVDEQAKKTQSTSSRMADIASKAASKTAETAGGALLGAAIGSVVPGVGTALGGALGGVLSGMGAEALTDWLRGFLTKPDIDLLLDPAKRLATDFLADMAKAAEKKRIVLLLDTYEQMTALEDWVGEIAQKMHLNILMVIAGRKLPDGNRAWQGWIMNAQVEELRPMTEDIMRQLIRRYYSTMRGDEPNPEQVEAIIHFARGLPMVVTSAVQLWVKYGVEDFQSIKPEIVANLVDRLMEGIPKTLIPTLEAAAVVRWFDQPILRAVAGLTDVRDLYDELRHFPFVRTRVEGLVLHDAIREIMDENLRVQDSEQHHELHKRAATYFEKKLEESATNARFPATNDLARKELIEFLYHRISINPEDGFNLAKLNYDTALRQYQLVVCDEILGLLKTITFLDKKLKCWIDYLSLQIVQSRASWENSFDALENLLLQNIPLELEVEARWNYGVTLEYLGKREQAFQQLSLALKILKSTNSHNLVIQAKILTRLGILQVAFTGFESGFQSLNEALVIARKTGIKRLIIDTLNEINYIMQKPGYFEKAIPILEEIIKLSEETLDKREQGIAHARLGEYFIIKGDYSEKAKEHLEKASNLLKAVDDVQSWSWAYRNLGMWFMGHNDPQTAKSYYEQSVDGYKKRKATRGLLRSQVALCECYLVLSEYQEISKLAADIEHLAGQVKMNEWTTRWMLIQGHLAWENRNLSEVLHYYQEAMIYAFHYNRFLLDEVLSGRPQDTLLLPILPYCLERGEEGKKILTALRDWWKKGVNEIGLPLLEAEKITRNRELGDGSAQKSVIEQIETVL